MLKNTKKQLISPQIGSTVEKAFGNEVSLFLHCHLRGYDKDGTGQQMCANYYDQYGAPVEIDHSWLEGYHVIEKSLGDYFKLCELIDFPPVAGSAGGVHLYKQFHSNITWNWTGWVPLQQIWLCQGKFFSNRYFLSIRGNEIQNNLWDYPPHKEEEDVDEMEYSQVEPTDRYKGGYFYNGDPFGRYLHLISLRTHRDVADLGKPLRPIRYNFIVHPLAYRRSLNDLPDNGVDAMQWSIINIVYEGHFDANSHWGDKCHGLEIFNDFTYNLSYAPEIEGGCHNGTLSRRGYIDYFDTYPLEYAEFLLVSALARGVYLHTLTNNDAFYEKMTRDDPDKPEQEQKELINRTLSDPKGGIQVKMLKERQGASHVPPVSRTEQILTERCAGDKKKMADFEKMMQIMCSRPYGLESVFGFTTLVDTERKTRDYLFKRDHDVRGTSLDEVEVFAMEYLTEGNFFSSTGVYNIFDYSAKDQDIPYVIKNQPDPTRMCNNITKEMALEFTFEKGLKKNQRLVWRYVIMIETDSKTLETVHGYFKLSTTGKTVLDLSEAYKLEKVKWLYFVVVDPNNPMKRAWFNAVKGPAFGQPPRPDLIQYDLPDLQHKVFSTTIKDGKVVQDVQVQPLGCKSANLDFLFPQCDTEKDDIWVYFLQVYPHQQDITIEGKTDQSSTERPPRILQSVHGLFLLHPKHKTRIKLSNSWDKNTVKDAKIYFYKVNASIGKPQIVSLKPEAYEHP